MDVLHGPEGLLPELEFDRGVELGEAGIEMGLKRFGVGKIDGMGLVRVLGDVGEMKAEGLAEPAEFDLSLMLKAELERLVNNLLHSETD